jgi:hypothetical protein
MAVFTSSAVLLISSLLPPICRKMQVKLVMASRSFLVVLVCGCAHHTSPIRRDVWIIHYRGKLFFPVVWESLVSVRVRVRPCLGWSSILGAFLGLQLGCVDMWADMGDD